MKKISIIVLLLLVAVGTRAQYNRFVYFRYDAPSYNNWTIIQRINGAFANADQKTMFFEDRIFQGESLDSLLTDPHFLATTANFNPELEKQTLNEFFQQMLKEQVGTRGKMLQIEGVEDRNWACTFIVSESASLDELAQFIDVNNLLSRGIKLQFLVYSQEGEIESRSYSSLFKNQISKNIINNNNDESNENED